MASFPDFRLDGTTHDDRTSVRDLISCAARGFGIINEAQPRLLGNMYVCTSRSKEVVCLTGAHTAGSGPLYTHGEKPQFGLVLPTAPCYS